jgi:LytS/YehU family sensor histidine kinase
MKPLDYDVGNIPRTTIVVSQTYLIITKNKIKNMDVKEEVEDVEEDVGAEDVVVTPENATIATNLGTFYMTVQNQINDQ